MSERVAAVASRPHSDNESGLAATFRHSKVCPGMNRTSSLRWAVPHSRLRLLKISPNSHHLECKMHIDCVKSFMAGNLESVLDDFRLALVIVVPPQHLASSSDDKVLVSLVTPIRIRSTTQASGQAIVACTTLQLVSSGQLRRTVLRV